MFHTNAYFSRACDNRAVIIMVAIKNSQNPISYLFFNCVCSGNGRIFEMEPPCCYHSDWKWIRRSNTYSTCISEIGRAKVKKMYVGTILGRCRPPLYLASRTNVQHIFILQSLHFIDNVRAEFGGLLELAGLTIILKQKDLQERSILCVTYRWHGRLLAAWFETTIF